jgi:hypothetical protein
MSQLAPLKRCLFAQDEYYRDQDSLYYIVRVIETITVKGNKKIHSWQVTMEDCSTLVETVWDHEELAELNLKRVPR